MFQGNIMSETIDFIYKKEFWYVSAFVNEKTINGALKAKEIEALVQTLLSSITVEDLKRIRDARAEVIKEEVVEMCKNASITCSWVPYIADFPYQDENTEREYNTLGYFQFEMEYYKDLPERKQEITPVMIQQIPILVRDKLADYERREENKYLNLDNESPIYVFVASNKSVPEDVQWSQDNIEKYKQTLGNWIEIYSGAWSDYNEALYDMRIRNNLSNRLSELHFIRRNSGFVYMAEENYTNFFDSYMRKFVLEPTARIRSILYAVMSINHSLDLLFTKLSSPYGLIDIDVIEKKLNNLRLLRGVVQTNMSIIYDELDHNLRQHYTAVLRHLIREFQLDNIIDRIGNKFEVIYNAMSELYQKKNAEGEKKTQRGVTLLNILFGIGIIATLSDHIIQAETAVAGTYSPNYLDMTINIIVSGIIAVVFIYTASIILQGRKDAKKASATFTVDAVIVDGKGNIILQKRANPPFKGFYAIPGTFIKEGENHAAAIERLVKEEVGGIKIRRDKKIGVFDKKGRDPRGNVITTAYKCTVISDLDKNIAELIPLAKVKELTLAFDHKKILENAGLI